ncbi:MAG: hypothetical protein IH840_17045 [Candidatus Heimdallarchaeota archaeon]|nr:hypothetical protein [Candidatus Heimdallarchaeota archaeon]
MRHRICDGCGNTRLPKYRMKFQVYDCETDESKKKTLTYCQSCVDDQVELQSMGTPIGDLS